MPLRVLHFPNKPITCLRFELALPALSKVEGSKVEGSGAEGLGRGHEGEVHALDRRFLQGQRKAAQNP